MRLDLLTVLAITFQLALTSIVKAEDPDWSEGTKIPIGGRANIFQLNDVDFEKFKNAGKIHAQIYPVSVTGILPPFEPIRQLAEGDSENPLRKWLHQIMRGLSGVHSFDDILKSLGLNHYPRETDEGVYSVPYPQGVRPEHRMGVGWIERNGATGFTFSCAACHSSHLFGKTVLGMTNRFPRANEFFIKAKNVVTMTEPHIFKYYTGSTREEMKLFQEARQHLFSVGLKPPLALGLDTSLAQVALSLNRRANTPYANYSKWFAFFPRRDEILDDHPADSKPAVWWNVKYKNRWLSDGSVVSGNPIYTNILWNEIGRGADLTQLEKWLDDNKKLVDELATAVFSSEAPRITDFFPEERINLPRAKAGEVLFNKTCAKCHGYYDKAWSINGSEHLPPKDQIKTVRVRYRETTPVINVGTDPFRWQGMKSLEKLNALAISKKNGILIRAQEGYVPPPLVGIWARWPYFHNNSIPNLCALLTPSEKRPKTYYSGEANDPNRDFDFECNGYPLNQKTPREWITRQHFFDTRIEGLGNGGHDKNIFIKDGKEILTGDDKKNLIHFLQTL